MTSLMRDPTITAVVTVYNAERYIRESSLGFSHRQTPQMKSLSSTTARPMGHMRCSGGLASDIRLVRQPNRGHPAH